MVLKIDKILKIQGPPLSLCLFLLGCFVVYVNFMRVAYDSAGVMFSGPIRTFFIMGGPILLLASTLFALLEGGISRLQQRYQLWYLLLLIVMGVVLFNGFIVQRNGLRYITFDVLLLSFCLPGVLIGAKRSNFRHIDRFVVVVFTINVVILLTYIGEYTNIGAVIRSVLIEAQGQTPYFFWGGLITWPYLALTFRDRSMFVKVVTVAGIFLYHYLGIVFLKRAALIYLSMFIILLIITYRHEILRKFRVRYALLALVGTAGVLMVVGVMNIGSSLDRTLARFVQEGNIVNTVVRSNRVSYDYGIVGSQLQPLELLVGRGVGGTVIDVKGNYPERAAHVLHNGVAFVVLKGGIIFLLVWYFGWTSFLVDFFRNRRITNAKYYIPVLIPLLISSVFGFISGSVHFLLLTVCAGRMMSNDKEYSETSRK